MKGFSGLWEVRRGSLAEPQASVLECCLATTAATGHVWYFSEIKVMALK